MIPIELFTYSENLAADGCFYEVFGVLFWLKSVKVISQMNPPLISPGFENQRDISPSFLVQPAE